MVAIYHAINGYLKRFGRSDVTPPNSPDTVTDTVQDMF